MRLIDHLRALFQRLIPVAEELGTGDMIAALRDDAMRSGNDSRWLRNQFHRLRDLPLVVEAISTAWRGSNREPAPAEPAAVLRRRIRATSEPWPRCPARSRASSCPTACIELGGGV